MCIARRKARFREDLQFYMDGKCLATVNEFPHLGHIITSNLNDKSDIISKKIPCVAKLIMCYAI